MSPVILAIPDTMKKTNAARLLEGMGITYELREYPVDEEHLDAEEVARRIGMPLEQVFKTLVTRGDRTGVMLAIVPGSCELSLHKLAAVSGNKRVTMVESRKCSRSPVISAAASPPSAPNALPGLPRRKRLAFLAHRRQRRRARDTMPARPARFTARGTGDNGCAGVTGCGIQDSGFRIQDSGFGIVGFGIGIRDSGFGIRDSGFGIGIRDSGFGLAPARAPVRILLSDNAMSVFVHVSPCVRVTAAIRFSRPAFR